MDGVTFEPRMSAMPARAPMQLGAQDFAVLPSIRAPHIGPDLAARKARVRVFGGAVLLTVAFLAAQTEGLSYFGITGAENLHLVLAGFAFFWIAVSLCSAVLGTFARPVAPRQARSMGARAMSVALLMPVHNEEPAAVFGNLSAMLADLRRAGGGQFTLFVLSDTRDDAIAEQEWRCFTLLQAEAGGRFPVYYRRRAQNTDRKCGNIAEWLENWGGAQDAMLVLDADSVMSADAILALRDALAADRSAGLVQTWPRITGARSLFARMQQFVTAAHGGVLARGLALWAGNSANYWGHNAIIRTRAFADAAILPHLEGVTGRRSLIMSHDFVEAALLKRAGWAVRFLPDIADSYEETPANLMDHIQRDRRWCRGNMQHLRLLAARGLHPLSRFHLLQGAASYLLAPVWLMLMAIWAFPQAMGIAMGQGGQPPVPQDVPGFVGANYLLLGAVILTLLGPKILSTATTLLSTKRRAAFGGTGPFLRAVLAEAALSVIYAPILMVQQVLAVASSILFARDSWLPQRRAGSAPRWRDLLEFHVVETALGLAVLTGIMLGSVTLWLLPIAICLALAVPLSWVSGKGVGLRAIRMDTPEDLSAPAIVLAADMARADYARALQTPDRYRIAAE